MSVLIPFPVKKAYKYGHPIMIEVTYGKTGGWA